MRERIRDTAGRDGRRGVALILVLVILASLSLLALGISHRCRLSSRLAGLECDRACARQLAEGGLVVAIDALREDGNEIDHLGEPWHRGLAVPLCEWFEDERLSAMTGASVSVSCRDEESKINVNTASRELLKKVPGLSEEFLANLLDWMDEDDHRRPRGAESPYYRAQPQPYLAKNGPLEIMPEFLLIKGATRAAFWGEDANQNLMLDPWENDGAQSYPLDDADGELDLGLCDVLTLHGSGILNLNTVPLDVLELLPGLSEDTARALIEERDGTDRMPGTDDDRPFQSLEDLEDVPGVSDFELYLLGNTCGLTSQHFRIVSRATLADGTTCELELLVRRADGDVMPLLRREYWTDPRWDAEHGR